MKKTVCIIEEDETVRSLLTEALEASGYRTLSFETEGQMFSEDSEETPDLILYDEVPGTDSAEAIRCIRALNEPKTVPVLLFTESEPETERKPDGPDECMKRPFGILELLLRIRKLIRITEQGRYREEVLEAGSLRMNTGTGETFFREERLSLTRIEAEVLRYLMECRGQTAAREELAEAIWGHEEKPGSRTLDMHIKTLRRKIPEGGPVIRTVRGIGYRLEDSPRMEEERNNGASGTLR